MANYLSDRTGASIDAVLDDADAGGIGKETLTTLTSDLDDIVSCGFYSIGGGATNNPEGLAGTLLVNGRATPFSATQVFTAIAANRQFIRSLNTSVWTSWQELYHTGNTGLLEFSDTSLVGGENTVRVRTNQGQISLARTGTSTVDLIVFGNANGIVGNIRTSGTATSYNTSSDPRLKDFAEAPTDSAINAEFSNLFSCFRTFNWKSDPQGDLVWGFDAHACIDAKTGMGSEGKGSRGLNLGDVYETIPAVTENRVVNDAEGNPTSEIETVVITAAIEKKVSPAGVDQSKAVPILLAKIEQLERRLSLLGG